MSNLRYVDRSGDGSRIAADYALNFSSRHLEAILDALGAGDPMAAIDPSARKLHAFLVELAGALATLPDDQIDVAAGVDVTYRVEASLHNVVDFAEWAEDQWEGKSDLARGRTLSCLSAKGLFAVAGREAVPVRGLPWTDNACSLRSPRVYLASMTSSSLPLRALLPSLPNVRAEAADRFAQAIRALVESRAQDEWPNEGEEDVAVFVMVDRPRQVGEKHGAHPFADLIAKEEPILGRLFLTNRDASGGRFMQMPVTDPNAILEWLDDNDLAGCPLVIAYRKSKTMVTRRAGIGDLARRDPIRDHPPSATLGELLAALEHFHINRLLTPTCCSDGVWEQERAQSVHSRPSAREKHPIRSRIGPQFLVPRRRKGRARGQNKHWAHRRAVAQEERSRWTTRILGYHRIEGH